MLIEKEFSKIGNAEIFEDTLGNKYIKVPVFEDSRNAVNMRNGYLKTFAEETIVSSYQSHPMKIIYTEEGSKNLQEIAERRKLKNRIKDDIKWMPYHIKRKISHFLNPPYSL